MPLLTEIPVVTPPATFSKTTLVINAVVLTAGVVAEVLTRVWPTYAPLFDANVAKSVGGLIVGLNTAIQFYKLYTQSKAGA
jgi:hypothetical protein